jgi:hypothetical protein
VADVGCVGCPQRLPVLEVFVARAVAAATWRKVVLARRAGCLAVSRQRCGAGVSANRAPIRRNGVGPKVCNAAVIVSWSIILTCSRTSINDILAVSLSVSLSLSLSLSAHNVFRGELVRLHAGFHLALHPLRQSPLVQIIRSPRTEDTNAVQVKIASHKKRLTRNTFVMSLTLPFVFAK